MSSRGPETDLRGLWQGVETERTAVTVEQIQLRAQELLRKDRRDTIARFVFALLASAFCGLVVMNSRLTGVRIVAVLLMAMLLLSTARRLFHAYRAGAERPAVGSPWSSCMEFYRSELEKQRSFAELPVWQMVAALLAITWLTSSTLRRSNSDPTRAILLVVLFAAAGLIVLMAVRKFQARRIQGDIKALDQFERESLSGNTNDITLKE